MRLAKTTAAALAITAVFAALPACAQATSGAGAQSPRSAPQTLQVYTRETVVDVLVTDAKGQPVRGLKQSDFKVEEDGKPQPIRSFVESGQGAPLAGHVPPPLPAGVYTNYDAGPKTGPVNILLIDSLNVAPMLAARAQQEVAKYLQTMPEGTQVAILSLSWNGLHVLQGFTSDRERLLRAMDANFLVLGTNTEVIRRDWATIDALNQIAAYVSAIKGRKNLLWFAPGVPILLTRDGGYSWGAGNMTLVHKIMDTYELFTAEQIAVSPVDPSGVTGLGMANLKSEAVAEATGGIAKYNTNDVRSAVEKVIDDSSHYYTLSYMTPRLKDDGHFHRIKIIAVRPGLHLVYRTGYNAEQPPEPISPLSGPALMQASMAGQAPPATQLLFDVRVQPSPQSSVQPGAAESPASGRRALPMPDRASVQYGFLYAIPQSQIAFADAPDGNRKGTLEFDIGAFDLGGRLINSLSQTMQLPLTAAEYVQFIRTPFQFYQQLDLPPGKVLLRVGVLDSVSHKVGALEIPLTVPKGPPAPAVAAAPSAPAP